MGLILGAYFVPALLMFVPFWVVWRLIRLLPVAVTTKRSLFVFLGILAFSPIIAPAGVKFVAFFPNGLLLAGPDFGSGPVVSYYPKFWQFVLASVAGTTVMFYFVARRWIATVPDPEESRWKTVSASVAVLCVLTGVHLYVFPSYELPDRLDVDAVEAVYGGHVNDFSALLQIESELDWETEAAGLRENLQFDSTILRHHVLTCPSSSAWIILGTVKMATPVGWQLCVK